MLNWGGETEMSIPLNLSKLRTRQFSGAFLMLIAALAAGLTFNYRGSQPIDRSDSSCREIVREAATINSVQLAQLHNKIGETSDRIHQWLGSPHCILPKAAIRSGIITDREAYQLNNVSQVILAYESGQLIGFKRDPIQVTSSHKEIELKQTWELQTGDSIVGHDIVGGLGGSPLKSSRQSTPLQMESSMATLPSSVRDLSVKARAIACSFPVLRCQPICCSCVVCPSGIWGW